MARLFNIPSIHAELLPWMRAIKLMNLMPSPRQEAKQIREAAWLRVAAANCKVARLCGNRPGR